MEFEMVEMSSRGVMTTETQLKQQSNDMDMTSSSSEYYQESTTQSLTSAQNVYKLNKNAKILKSPTKIEFSLVKSPKFDRKKMKRKSMKFPNNSKPVCPCKSAVIDIERDLSVGENFDVQKVSRRWSDKMKSFFLGPKKSNHLHVNDEEKAESFEIETRKPAITFYFERGCPEFYKTFDRAPHLMSDNLAEQTTQQAIQFWAEMFGFLNIALIFFITFFLQLLKFILYTIFRVLLVGILEILSDYMLKPFFMILFNGFIQPPMIFIQNIFISIANVMEPISESIGYLLWPVTRIFQAFRIVEVKQMGEQQKCYKTITRLDESGDDNNNISTRE